MCFRSCKRCPKFRKEVGLDITCARCKLQRRAASTWSAPARQLSPDAEYAGTCALTLESASSSCCMIVQGSCALGSFRMQPGPTNRIDAAGALIAPMGDGLGSIASSCESNGIATCTRRSLESTVCLWNAHGLCGAERACCWARNVAFADISIHRVCLLVQASGSAARWPRPRG